MEAHYQEKMPTGEQQSYHHHQQQQQQQQQQQSQYPHSPDQYHQQYAHAQAPMSASHQHMPPPDQARGEMPLHPSAYGQKGGDWQAGLCSWGPCGSCLLAWCIPCVLLGQTSERIRDPSMQDADMLNSDCLIHGAITCFTGCGWIYQMMKRTEIRERYDIPGSGCGDCCASYWCPCCTLIQQDNEVKIRQRNGQPTDQGYQSQPGMQMPPAAYHPQ
ncbi:PLAC8-domain-containing protein [Xylariomycetidae sp. FL0641]|nr:PLAC8-domain-containing protein [Xylariomycetidae sp. FL0641]